MEDSLNGISKAANPFRALEYDDAKANTPSMDITSGSPICRYPIVHTQDRLPEILGGCAMAKYTNVGDSEKSLSS